MKDARVVGRGQRGGEALRDLDDLGGGQRARAFEASRQVLAFDQLHGEKRSAGVVADVVDPADGRMGDLAREPHLLHQPLAQQSVGAMQDLERDGLPQHAVVHGVDLAHAARAERPLDAIAAGENLPAAVAHACRGARARVVAGPAGSSS